MEDRERLRSLIEQPVRQVDDEAGVPTPAEVATSFRVMSQRLSEREISSLKGIGVLGPQPLRRIVSLVFEGFASSAMAALFGRRVKALTATELEQLRSLVEQAELEDE